MGKQITPEQVAQFRQLWLDGYSIPEIAKICSTTASTIKKYLRSDIKTYIEQHTQAAERRQQEPVSIKEVIAQVEIPNEEPLTYSQFESYAQQCLTECADDIVEIRDCYYSLKDDARQEYRKVIRLRELYEVRLSQLSPAEEQYEPSQCNADIIRTYRDSLKCKLPISKDCETWDNERLYEHLAYWMMRRECTNEQTMKWLEENPDLETRMQYINNQ